MLILHQNLIFYQCLQNSDLRPCVTCLNTYEENLKHKHEIFEMSAFGVELMTMSLFEYSYVKYQVWLSVQHWIYKPFWKKKNFFSPLNILQKVEQGPLYKMDRKFKANWKLTIGWGIFYMQFSFWSDLFWKRFADNTCSGVF